MDPISPLILSVALILIAAKLGGHVAARFKQPPVLGELTAGLLMGNLGLLGFHAGRSSTARLSGLPPAPAGFGGAGFGGCGGLGIGRRGHVGFGDHLRCLARALGAAAPGGTVLGGGLRRAGGGVAVPGARLTRSRAVVGEEVVPGGVDARRVGEVTLVHVLDQPLVGAEVGRGGM